MRLLVSAFQRISTADLRSLALLRIATALVLLGDLLQRAQDLTAHYSDEGVLPRTLLPESAGVESFSRALMPHLWSGEPWVEATLFAVAAAFGLLLFFGYRTRLAATVSWLLLCSLQARNPLVSQGGDSLLRLILFWGSFLPWGRRFSLDRRRDPDLTRGNNVSSLALGAFVCQIAIVYVTAASWKLNATWLHGGAVCYVLQDPVFGVPRNPIAAVPGLCTFLSMPVVVIEMAIGLMLVTPWKANRFRSIAVIGGCMLHGAFALWLNVGNFPYADLAGLLFFLPSMFWEAVGDRQTAAQPTSPWKNYRLEQWLLAALLSYTLVLNAMNRLSIATPQFGLPAEVLHIQQSWGMFSDPAFIHSSWFAAKGVRRDGSQVFLANNGALVAANARGPGDFSNHRWRRFIQQIWDNQQLLSAYDAYLCRLWRSPPAEQLTSVGIDIFTQHPRSAPELTQSSLACN